MRMRRRYEYEYPRPLLTADVIALAGASEALSVLLVQRRHPPFAGSWALQGASSRKVSASWRRRHASCVRRRGSSSTHMSWMRCSCLASTTRQAATRVAGPYPPSTSRACGRARYIAAADDASEARWFGVAELPNLAFDHALIVADALAVVGPCG